MLAPDGIDFSRVLVIGVGKADAADGMSVERWAGHAVRRALTSGAEKLVLQPDALPGVTKAEAGAHAAMGARLSSYRFDTYRTKLKPDQQPTLTAVEIMIEAPAAARARAEKDAAIVEGVFFARDLVSEPPNVLYPESFAERLRDLETLGVDVEVLEPDDDGKARHGRAARRRARQRASGAAGDHELEGRGVEEGQARRARRQGRHVRHGRHFAEARRRRWTR